MKNFTFPTVMISTACASCCLCILSVVLHLLASLLWGDFWVFAITSVIAALIDSVFVILQRYNRPRLMRLLEKRKKKGPNNV